MFKQSNLKNYLSDLKISIGSSNSFIEEGNVLYIFYSNFNYKILLIKRKPIRIIYETQMKM